MQHFQRLTVSPGFCGNLSLGLPLDKSLHDIQQPKALGDSEAVEGSGLENGNNVVDDEDLEEQEQEELNMNMEALIAVSF